MKCMFKSNKLKAFIAERSSVNCYVLIVVGEVLSLNPGKGISSNLVNCLLQHMIINNHGTKPLGPGCRALY